MRVSEGVSTRNPENPLSFGLINNVYRTENSIIGAYHYVTCLGDEFIRPADTQQTAQAVAHYYRLANVSNGCAQAVGFRAARSLMTELRLMFSSISLSAHLPAHLQSCT